MPRPTKRPKESQLEKLIRETKGHGEMCPCDSCKQLRRL